MATRRWWTVGGRRLVVVPAAVTLVLSGCSQERGLTRLPADDATAAAPTPSPAASPTAATADAATADQETPSARPDPETAATEATLDLARDYLTALASSDPGRQQDAVRLTAPGSPARAYATFQLAQARAMAEQELERPQAEVRVARDEVTLCYGGACATYRDFRAQGAPARLVGFDVADVPVGDRVVTAAPGSVPLGPAQVDLVGALQAATEDTTLVALEVRTGETRLDLALFLSEYEPPDGATRPVVDAIGPVELAPGAIATVILVFERAAFGGTVHLAASTDHDQHAAELRLPAG